jgi:putative tricarboxylic transport membrane protein
MLRAVAPPLITAVRQNANMQLPLHGKIFLAPYFLLLLAVFFSIDCHSQISRWKPGKSVEFIVPAGPGGSNDKIPRLIQSIIQDQKMMEVPISVVNKPGGNQSIGMLYLNQRPGDGHFLAFVSASLVTNSIVAASPELFKNVTPVAILLSEYVTFVVKSDSPIKTVKDLLERLKKDASSINIALSSAIGNHNHIAIAMVAKAVNVDPKLLKIAVFKSSSEVVTALLGGHVNVAITPPSNIVPFLQSRDVRIIGVSAPSRLGGELASVPTLVESGVNVVVNGWRGVVARQGTAEQQLMFWESVLAEVTKTNEWDELLRANLWQNEFLNGKDAKLYIQNEREKFQAILLYLGLAK